MRKESGAAAGTMGVPAPAQGGRHVPRLTVLKGADQGKQFEVTGDALSVGRDSTNKVRLNDTEVSRRHAEFQRTPQGYRLLDVGSVNGTFVNGQAARDVLLQPGDQIQIGQSVLLYSAARADAPPAPPLAEQINLITRQDLELNSAIVRTVGEAEGSRILAHPDSVQGPWLKGALVNLRTLYEVSTAVSHILDLNELLDRIMDLIFKTLEADRGCIMLRAEGVAEARADDFEPKAVRWREGVNRQEKIGISRTLMEHVLREKQGVLVNDAARDDRFGAVQSIVRSGIREIICVPMKGRHETLGVLYLDSRTPGNDRNPTARPRPKFTEDHLSLAAAIAHQAALAVEETRYYQAMVQAERLAAVGQTIAALSHHIKNILQGLRSGGDILKMGLEADDKELLQRGWRIVEKNQSKVYDLVKDMLSYSKEREPNYEPVEVNSLAQDVVDLMAERARELGIRLEAKLDSTLSVCAMDREGIHRSLLNIVGNAFDAVEDSEGPCVTVETGIERDTVFLRVVDNGSGIPEDRLRDIFRPFVSTKGSRGTGLGLAVSRKVLREHGGDLTVESLVGRGSTFTLRLPLRTAVPQDINATLTGDQPALPPEAN